MVGEARDDGFDKNPCAVGGSLNDKALEVVITKILPLGLDADTVADFKGYGDDARDRIVTVQDVKIVA